MTAESNSELVEWLRDEADFMKGTVASTRMREAASLIEHQAAENARLRKLLCKLALPQGTRTAEGTVTLCVPADALAGARAALSETMEK